MSLPLPCSDNSAQCVTESFNNIPILGRFPWHELPSLGTLQTLPPRHDFLGKTRHPFYNSDFEAISGAMNQEAKLYAYRDATFVIIAQKVLGMGQAAINISLFLFSVLLWRAF